MPFSFRVVAPEQMAHATSASGTPASMWRFGGDGFSVDDLELSADRPAARRTSRFNPRPLCDLSLILDALKQTLGLPSDSNVSISPDSAGSGGSALRLALLQHCDTSDSLT